MFHLFLPFFVQFSLLERIPWTVASKLLASCNLVGFGQEKTLAISRWMGERRGDGNNPSHFLPAVVLPVVAFCYPLLGHPTSTALVLSGGRKTISFACLFKPKTATSISPLLLIPVALLSLHQPFNPVQPSVKSSLTSPHVNPFECVTCFLLGP